MPDIPTTADELRRAFIEFFTERGARARAVGERDPGRQDAALHRRGHGPVQVVTSPARRRRPTSGRCRSQKCVRAGGKHNDLDDIGRTNRHFSFFEMLGNFSFGDYFKAEAIPWAWEFYTSVLQLDPDSALGHGPRGRRRSRADLARRRRLSGRADPAARRGQLLAHGRHRSVRAVVGDLLGSRPGVRARRRSRHRIRPLHRDLEPRVHAVRPAEPTARASPLPKPSIDTGAGLERNLMVVQDTSSIWDIDVFQPLLAAAQRATGARYGRDERTDISLRIIAEHARTMTFMVADGVRPSNQERGYVLRRIIRRAVRHAYLLGARDIVLPGMIDAVVATMGSAYPEIAAAARRRAQGRRTRGGVRSGQRCNAASTCSTSIVDEATSPATTRSSCTTRSGSRST